MSLFATTKSKLKLLSVLVVSLGAFAFGWHYLFFSPSYGAQLGQRTLKISNNEASGTSIYALSFNLSTTGTLGSVLVQFCSNDPLPNTTCTAPAGFSASAATLASQTGPGGFSISSASTANELIFKRTPSVEPASPVSFQLTGVQNPSTPGSYYVRVLTYATDDATGPNSDYGGIAFDINNQISITATVPPYLIFCTGITITNFNCVNAQGSFIDLGELSSRQSKSGSSQILVATNAADGYSVTSGGTTMASGNNFIAAMDTSDVSRPGTAQFGLNLTSNSTPSVGGNPTGPGLGQPQPNYNQSNSFRFVDGDIILARPVPDDVRVYTVSYLVNVPATQAPGIYVTTITYVCLADF
jgi:hypothetical protein